VVSIVVTSEIPLLASNTLVVNCNDGSLAKASASDITFQTDSSSASSFSRSSSTNTVEVGIAWLIAATLIALVGVVVGVVMNGEKVISVMENLLEKERLRMSSVLASSTVGGIVWTKSPQSSTFLTCSSIITVSCNFDFLPSFLSSVDEQRGAVEITSSVTMLDSSIDLSVPSSWTRVSF
jgi:xanthosine utilization system XapX-like protein